MSADDGFLGVLIDRELDLMKRQPRPAIVERVERADMAVAQELVERELPRVIRDCIAKDKALANDVYGHEAPQGDPDRAIGGKYAA